MWATATTVAPELTGAELSLETIRMLSAARNEPDWMCAFRENAWITYQGMEWPAPTDEDWRRTRLTGLRLEDFTITPPQGPPVTAAEMPLLLQQEAGEMESAAKAIYENGNLLFAEGRRALREQGVIFQELSSAIQEHPALLQEHFMTRVVPVERTVFTALHGALWDAGTLIYVPRNVEVELPLQIISHQTAGSAVFHHTLIVVEENASVTVVDDLLGGRNGLQNSVVEIVQQPNSRVRYMNMQDLDLSAWNLMYGRAELQRDADLRWIQVSWGSRLTKAYLDLAMIEPGVHAELLGIYFPALRQHIDHQTLQHHRAPHCFSDLLFNGALKDRAHSVYMGSIRVDRHAQNTDAFQRNGNLILDGTTRRTVFPDWKSRPMTCGVPMPRRPPRWKKSISST